MGRLARKWPPRLKSRLRALGFTRSDDADAATPNAEVPDAADADPDVTQPQPVRPPHPRPLGPEPEPDIAARVTSSRCGNDDSDDNDEAAPTPSPPPPPVPVFREPASRGAAAADRVWPPAPDRRASDLIAEIERNQAESAPRDWYRRDCRW